MAFRADEAAIQGYERVRSYLVPREFAPSERIKSEEALRKIVDELGPPIEGYPTWHPLVARHDPREPETYPSERCGYRGLDHTRFFAHGFITCPYGDGQAVIDSAAALDRQDVASITAERLDVPFYSMSATPVLVRCEWSVPMEAGLTIPKAFAVPLMLEQEVPCWHWATHAETWETMRPYLLGQPHGSRSSLFVSQDTALAMKNVYLAMVASGMFGPTKV